MQRRLGRVGMVGAGRRETVPDHDAGSSPVPFDPVAARCFRYVGYELDQLEWTLRCHYQLDDLGFEEVITFEPRKVADVDPETVDRAAGLVFLMAGVSYFKAAAPPSIEVTGVATTDADRRLLEATYLNGLGEYAFRNGLDLSQVEISYEGGVLEPMVEVPSGRADRPLVPFGGGIDSIVTVEGLREANSDLALFIVSKAGDRFQAIEAAAEVAGLPIVRASRLLDPKILRSGELGYRNGHVPVTGIISSIAVVAALASGRDSVVMSNEWSASSGNLVIEGRVVNHQWSKSMEFEDLFRAAVAARLSQAVDYYSWLRSCSELWVAERFSKLREYHSQFRSCNRAFHIDSSARMGDWCGQCDKCCFIDLVLAPFLSPRELAEIFQGGEPLENESLTSQFRTLIGVSEESKPFECVGDERECQVAAILAATRSDRADCSLLARLADEARTVLDGEPMHHAAELLKPLGRHNVPDRYAVEAQLG